MLCQEGLQAVQIGFQARWGSNHVLASVSALAYLQASKVLQPVRVPQRFCSLSE